jgi:hypothetical protein
MVMALLYMTLKRMEGRSDVPPLILTYAVVGDELDLFAPSALPRNI